MRGQYYSVCGTGSGIKYNYGNGGKAEKERGALSMEEGASLSFSGVPGAFFLRVQKKPYLRKKQTRSGRKKMI